MCIRDRIKTYEAADYAPEMCAVKSKLTDLRVRFEEMVARDRKVGDLVDRRIGIGAVSYTHLDVYKRQRR